MHSCIDAKMYVTIATILVFIVMPFAVNHMDKLPILVLIDKFG